MKIPNKAAEEDFLPLQPNFMIVFPSRKLVDKTVRTLRTQCGRYVLLYVCPFLRCSIFVNVYVNKLCITIKIIILSSLHVGTFHRCSFSHCNPSQVSKISPSIHHFGVSDAMCQFSPLEQKKITFHSPSIFYSLSQYWILHQ